jgi:hypothetical protein
MKWSIVQDDTDDLISHFTGNSPSQVAIKFFKYFHRYDKNMSSKDFKFINLRTKDIYYYLCWCKPLDEVKIYKNFTVEYAYFCKRLDRKKISNINIYIDNDRRT